jgi:hypothetical protein
MHGGLYPLGQSPVMVDHVQGDLAGQLGCGKSLLVADEAVLEHCAGPRPAMTPARTPL